MNVMTVEALESLEEASNLMLRALRQSLPSLQACEAGAMEYGSWPAQSAGAIEYDSWATRA